MADPFLGKQPAGRLGHIAGRIMEAHITFQVRFSIFRQDPPAAVLQELVRQYTIIAGEPADTRDGQIEECLYRIGGLQFGDTGADLGVQVLQRQGIVLALAFEFDDEQAVVTMHEDVSVAEPASEPRGHDMDRRTGEVSLSCDLLPKSLQLVRIEQPVQRSTEELVRRETEQSFGIRADVPHHQIRLLRSDQQAVRLDRPTELNLFFVAITEIDILGRNV